MRLRDRENLRRPRLYQGDGTFTYADPPSLPSNIQEQGRDQDSPPPPPYPSERKKPDKSDQSASDQSAFDQSAHTFGIQANLNKFHHVPLTSTSPYKKHNLQNIRTMPNGRGHFQRKYAPSSGVPRGRSVKRNKQKQPHQKATGTQSKVHQGLRTAFPSLSAPVIPSTAGSTQQRHGIKQLMEQKFSGATNKWKDSFVKMKQRSARKYPEGLDPSERDWYDALMDEMRDSDEEEEEPPTEITFRSLYPTFRQEIILQIGDEAEIDFESRDYVVKSLLDLTDEELRKIRKENSDVWENPSMPKHLLELRAKYPNQAIDPDTPPPGATDVAAAYLHQEHLPLSLLGEWCRLLKGSAAKTELEAVDEQEIENAVPASEIAAKDKVFSATASDDLAQRSEQRVGSRRGSEAAMPSEGPEEGGESATASMSIKPTDALIDGSASSLGPRQCLNPSGPPCASLREREELSKHDGIVSMNGAPLDLYTLIQQPFLGDWGAQDYDQDLPNVSEASRAPVNNMNQVNQDSQAAQVQGQAPCDNGEQQTLRSIPYICNFGVPNADQSNTDMAPSMRRLSNNFTSIQQSSRPQTSTVPAVVSPSLSRSDQQLLNNPYVVSMMGQSRPPTGGKISELGSLGLGIRGSPSPMSTTGWLPMNPFPQASSPRTQAQSASRMQQPPLGRSPVLDFPNGVADAQQPPCGQTPDQQKFFARLPDGSPNIPYDMPVQYACLRDIELSPQHVPPEVKAGMYSNGPSSPLAYGNRIRRSSLSSMQPMSLGQECLGTPNASASYSAHQHMLQPHSNTSTSTSSNQQSSISINGSQSRPAQTPPPLPANVAGYSMNGRPTSAHVAELEQWTGNPLNQFPTKQAPTATSPTPHSSTMQNGGQQSQMAVMGLGQHVAPNGSVISNSASANNLEALKAQTQRQKTLLSLQQQGAQGAQQLAQRRAQELGQQHMLQQPMKNPNGQALAAMMAQRRDAIMAIQNARQSMTSIPPLSLPQSVPQPSSQVNGARPAQTVVQRLTNGQFQLLNGQAITAEQLRTVQAHAVFRAQLPPSQANTTLVHGAVESGAKKRKSSPEFSADQPVEKRPRVARKTPAKSTPGRGKGRKTSSREG